MKRQLAREVRWWATIAAAFGGSEAKMCMMDEIAAKRDEIYAIAKNHKAEKLWVFGSFVRISRGGKRCQD